MTYSIYKSLELSVITVQFIACITTLVYAIIELVKINNIISKKEYRYFLSDHKSRLYLFNDMVLSPKYDSNYFDSQEDISRVALKRQNEDLTVISNNIWSNKYIKLNEKTNDKIELSSFRVVDGTDNCYESELTCFESLNFKTCFDGNPCPITFISRNMEYDKELVDKRLRNAEPSSLFTEVKKTDGTSLYFSSKIGGIPIVHLIVSPTEPCLESYIIKTQIVLEENERNNFSFRVISCDEIKDSYFGDKKHDIDLDEIMSSRMLLDGFPDRDIRYFAVDEMSANEFMSSFFTDYNGAKYEPTDAKLTLYARYMLYSRKECTYEVYLIFEKIRIENLTQLKIVLLRYLNWNIIELVYMLAFNLYLRGYYILKNLKKSKEKDLDKEKVDERKLQKETNFVIKMLHYFIIIIKLVSVFMSKYKYYPNVFPSDENFYNSCIVNEINREIYKQLNLDFIDLAQYIDNSLKINIACLIYDLVISFGLIIRSLVRMRTNLKQKSEDNSEMMAFGAAKARSSLSVA